MALKGLSKPRCASKVTFFPVRVCAKYTVSVTPEVVGMEGLDRKALEMRLNWQLIGNGFGLEREKAVARREKVARRFPEA